MIINVRAISKIIGIFLLLFSLSMLPPVVVNMIYQQDTAHVFYVVFPLTFFSGLLLWFSQRNYKKDLKSRDGFLIVFLFWVVLGAFGAIPFILCHATNLTFADAFFESVSGITTTGATIFHHLDDLPKSILFYRQELQFIGGMGIVVLAVAVLPMLGIGGMQLFRAETPGPIKDEKLRPRIKETAKSLWYIYAGMNVICILCYWLAGMTCFDAIGEGFSTVATGGFSMHDLSFGYYHSPLIEGIGVIFMFLSSLNFALHFKVFHQRSLRHYFQDVEVRSFFYIIVFTLVLTIGGLWFFHFYNNPKTMIMDSLFNVVSLATTTGLTSINYSLWPSYIPILLMVVALIGGCAASTSGGLKVVRFSLLLKQSNREMQRLIHPNGVFSIKFGNKVLPEHVVEAIWGFVATFVALYVLLFVLLTAVGLPMETAFGALTACLSNAGAGIAGIANNYDHISRAAKWILIFAMLLGRLEIFTVLVLLSPHYWRK